jgi:alpha-tubulin suppressor-like RCC1 family protein
MDFRRESRLRWGLPSVALAALAMAVLAPGASARVNLAKAIRREHLQSHISLTKSATTPYWACPESFCDAIVDPRPTRSAGDGPVRFAMPDGGPAFEGGGEEGGIDPQELRAAYNVPASGGEGQAIALIDAYGYADAESDLARYRSRYGLPACTKKHGCFRHLNAQGGKARNRTGDGGWEVESALDLDMASAACPGCHIVLVDAEGGTLKELGEAVDTAVAQGATEISNSYGLAEQDCEVTCESISSAYDHQGVMIMASAGDHGYDNFQSGEDSPNWPAVLPSVVAVGGTSLKKAADERGWSEEVWGEPKRELGTGSGCASARMGAKPAWQTDAGCSGRSDNDVAAVGACITPVSIYVSAEGGWVDVCGTSASSPLVAGIEAHADALAHSLPGADAFYHDPSALFDVTAGSNGLCSSPPGYEDLCNAGAGWDGPTGNGTPDGPLELTGVAPGAGTEPATAVSATGATFNGNVEANGLATSFRFEYGTNTGYGSSAPAPEGSVGAGTTAQPVSTTISSLQPDTTYHYRLVVTNSAGTSFGRGREFHTADTAAPDVTSVSPSGGGRSGYRPAQIVGAHFVDVSSVSFGSSTASFTVNSSTSITASVPVGEREGAVNVTVTTSAGTSAATPADEYTYTLGDVLAWGQDEGDLGRGFAGRFSDVPIEVSGELPEVEQLAAGGFGSAALLTDGEVVAWGEGADGVLGNGYVRQQDTPVKVCAVGVSSCPEGPYLTDVAQLISGYDFNLALLEDGTVVGWGRNGMGQLGGGAPLSPAVYTPVPVCTVVEEPCSPQNVLGEVTQLAAGHETSYALLANGAVLAWGANGLEGALGNGKNAYGEYSRTPAPVTGLSGVTSIAADGYGGLALLPNGTVESWGWNEYGTLGDGSKEEQSDVPVAVCSGAGKHNCGSQLSEVSAIYGTNVTSYALLKNGSLMAWGNNNRQNLGDPNSGGPEKCKVGVEQETQVCSRTPVKVDVNEVRTLATGQGTANVLALLEDGELVTWGSGAGGDLGGDQEGPLFGLANPVGICAPYSSELCPPGPDLSGEVRAMAVGGSHDLIYDRP